MHDRSLSCLGTGIAIKSDGAKLVLRAQTSPFSEMMWSLNIQRKGYSV